MELERGLAGDILYLELQAGSGVIGAVASPYRGVPAFAHETRREPLGIHQRFDLPHIFIGKIQEDEVLVDLARVDRLVVVIDQVEFG